MPAQVTPFTAGGPRFDMVEHRAHRGPVVLRGIETATNRYMPAPAGLQVMACPGMVVVGVVERAQDGVFVGDGRQPRQMLANAQARGAAGNGFVRPADTLGCLWFHVKCFELAGATKQEKKDHRLGFGPGWSGGLRSQQPGQIQAQQAATSRKHGAPMGSRLVVIARG